MAYRSGTRGAGARSGSWAQGWPSTRAAAKSRAIAAFVPSPVGVVTPHACSDADDAAAPTTVLPRAGWKAQIWQRCRQYIQ